jgi:hypothetical protein
LEHRGGEGKQIVRGVCWGWWAGAIRQKMLNARTDGFNART